MAFDLSGCNSTDVPAGPFELYVESFARERVSQGHADHGKASVNRREVAAFALWAKSRGVVPGELSDAHVMQFFACEESASGASERRRRRVLELFLGHLRRVGGSRSMGERADATPAGVVVRRYVQHLREERGLADRTVVAFEEWYRLREGELTRGGLRRRLAPIRLLLKRLLRRHINNPVPAARKIAKDLREYGAALWTFARVAGVEPTNNEALAARGISLVVRGLEYVDGIVDVPSQELFEPEADRGETAAKASKREFSIAEVVPLLKVCWQDPSEGVGASPSRSAGRS